MDLRASPIRGLILAGEPGGSIPVTRTRIEHLWGARVFDHSGMTEMGATSVECVVNPGGIHFIETEFIAEVVDSKTFEPVTRGVEGELVLTNLGRWGSPLIRYRTGDVVRLDPRPCPCGSPWIRLQHGILGRLDDMVIIRGNNLYPAALEELLRSIPNLADFRCTIISSDTMNTLRIEVEPTYEGGAKTLAERVRRAFRNRFHFRATVQSVPQGTLPEFEMKARRWLRKSRS